MIGERVRLAREACRLTQTELASTAGLGQGTVSDIEAGLMRPSEATLQAVAEATGYPVQFFHLGPLPDLPEGNYRRLRSGPSKVGRQVRAQVRQLVGLVQRAEDMLALPVLAIHPVRDVSSMQELEEIAARVRTALGVGDRDPIPNLTRALERAGVVVVRIPTEMEGHDGFSAWPDWSLGGRPIIALAGDHSGDRDRFTLAHELGHLVLHAVRTSIEPKLGEDEANRFAGALLLPRSAAVEAIRRPVTLSVLKAAKATYGISIAMAAHRAKDLELIGRDHYVSLMKQLSARGWRRDEPIEVPSERPVLMGRIIEAVAGPGGIRERASRVALPVFVLQGLAS